MRYSTAVTDSTHESQGHDQAESIARNCRRMVSEMGNIFQGLDGATLVANTDAHLTAKPHPQKNGGRDTQSHSSHDHIGVPALEVASQVRVLIIRLTFDLDDAGDGRFDRTLDGRNRGTGPAKVSSQCISGEGLAGPPRTGENQGT